MIKRITMIEGSSTALDVVEQVKGLVREGERVMVVLDSNHSREHVLNELRSYAPLVQVGGYMVATDGIMQDLVGAPRSHPDWGSNNPQEAARLFVEEDDRFAIEEPEWPFNEGLVRNRVTYWPSCYVRRVRQ